MCTCPKTNTPHVSIDRRYPFPKQSPGSVRASCLPARTEPGEDLETSYLLWQYIYKKINIYCHTYIFIILDKVADPPGFA